MIDKDKIELMLKKAQPISAACKCNHYENQKRTFIPKPKLKETPQGEEFEIVYVCSVCGVER